MPAKVKKPKIVSSATALQVSDVVKKSKAKVKSKTQPVAVAVETSEKDEAPMKRLFPLPPKNSPLAKPLKLEKGEIIMEAVGLFPVVILITDWLGTRHLICVGREKHQRAIMEALLHAFELWLQHYEHDDRKVTRVFLYGLYIGYNQQFYMAAKSKLVGISFFQRRFWVGSPPKSD